MMRRALRWLRARWRYIAALVIGLALGILVRRRRPTVPDARAARQLGEAEGAADEIAHTLADDAGDIQAEADAARTRDEAADREIAAAARRAADLPPESDAGLAPRSPWAESWRGRGRP